MTLHQLFWTLTKEKFTLREVNFGGAAKISTIFYQYCYLSPHELWMLMLNIRHSVYLVLTNALSSRSFDVVPDFPRYIRWNQHNTVCTILIKVDVLNTCGVMICSYFGIAFLLFFMKIKNTVYTSSQSSTLLFINVMNWFLTLWTFKITSLLNLNEYQC